MEHNYKIVRSFELEHKGTGFSDSFRRHTAGPRRKIRDTQRRMTQRKKLKPYEIKDDTAREMGKKGNRSKYLGGFIAKNGRSNNSSAYNHDYYIHNKDKWTNNVSSNPTERDVARARMDASEAINVSRHAIRTLLKDTDPDKARSLGWDEYAREEAAYAVKKQLESLATTNKYKKRNSPEGKLNKFFERGEKAVTRIISKGHAAARKVKDLFGASEKATNTSEDKAYRRRLNRPMTPTDSSSNTKEKNYYVSPRKTNNGKDDETRHVNNKKNGVAEPDPNKMSTEWRREMGYESAEEDAKENYVTTERKTNQSLDSTSKPANVSKEYLEEVEYNSRKNTYPSQASNSRSSNSSGSSSGDKYVSYKNKNMESGTLYKDEDGNIWRKLGGPGTNTWMKMN